jgi:hypothetical protein
MSGGETTPPAEVDWARIRSDYETAARPLTELAAAAGLSTPQALVRHAARDGWASRRGRARRPVATRDTLARLKTLLQARLAELEGSIGDLSAAAGASSSEKDIRAMNTLVRTLEKVLELERKDRAERRKRRHKHASLDDAEREALAQRLEALQRGRSGAAERPRGDGAQS